MLHAVQAPPPRKLDEGQTSTVWIANVETDSVEAIYKTTDVLVEAPNWSLDGSRLYLNGDGSLWSLELSSSTKELIKISYEGLPEINNDHVLHPDGKHIYLSANDWNIYFASLEGGKVELVTPSPPKPDFFHFLHGVSPDGKRLAFIGFYVVDGDVRGGGSNVYTIASDGTDYVQLTHGLAPTDGSEYSPGGEWIYFNTEQFDGHAQIARMRIVGSGVEQLTFNEKVNWFPHLPLLGRYATYIAFPTGTEGHPPEVWVDVMVVKDGKWKEAKIIARAFGGQGVMNVNSWSPDGTKFAYVSHDRS